MTIPMSSRETILYNLRSSIPAAKVDHPHIPAFERKGMDLRAEFEEHLREAGGAPHTLSGPEQAAAKLAELHPNAKVICSAVNVTGYHFHFLSEDRTKGGHLLGCSGANLRLRIERLSSFHLSLPESREFLEADLSKDPSEDLAYAEQVHKQENA